MLANVAEWTSDKSSATERIFRGLGWGSEQLTDLFPAKPHDLPVNRGQNNLGVRCAKTFAEADLKEDVPGQGGK
jgi:hypothetical protein